MAEAISDTGPILHLHEIGSLGALSVFEELILPERVAEEVSRLGVPPGTLRGLRFRLAVPKAAVSALEAAERVGRAAPVLQPTSRFSLWRANTTSWSLFSPTIWPFVARSREPTVLSSDPSEFSYGTFGKGARA